MYSENPAHYVLVDVEAERESNLLGNSATSPSGIPPFHFNDRIDEFFGRSFRARPSYAFGRKQRAVFSCRQHPVETQQSRWFENNGRPKNPCGAHQKGAQTSDNPIRNT